METVNDISKRHKTGGRQKGTPNKLTSEIRQVLKDLFISELQGLPDRLSKMDNDKRVEVLLRLTPYILPKIQSESFDLGEKTHWYDEILNPNERTA